MAAFKDLSELTITDDYMFGVVMQDEKNLKPLIEHILNIRIRTLRFIRPQTTFKEGYASKGVRLDLYVEDENGVVYNVEIQLSDRHDLPKRMRYYQSVLDVSVLRPGAHYEDLRKTFIIFICTYDPFGKGRSIYTFENRCIEDPELRFKDDAVKVIVNTKGTVGDISEELKEIIRYIDTGLAGGRYTQQLEESVRVIKASEERRLEYMNMMIREMEVRAEGEAKGRAEGEARGEARGRAEERQVAVANLIRSTGWTEQQARQALGYDLA